jgi:hypothetical protein
MLVTIMFILGGIGRAIVGTGAGPKWIGRWSVYPPIALLSAYAGLAPTLGQSGSSGLDLLTSFGSVGWAALIASLNLGLGYTQWESWKHMTLRFGLPALTSVLPMIYLHETLSPLLYPLLAVLVGLFYPYRQSAFEGLRLDRLSYSWLDSSRLAEFVAGACILGGLSIL